ncbi:Hypothetical protein PHPALM_37401 [Phytophthora palmivora]|uniref:Reverse transcriptase domain-containing protein n=1 Tax=Phytophthora palmivora TaxID=4796 RepID=A0A2P4WXJ2_9STRA|nr:Hypothetical protein PHPALM_37401 [Phytophthora palmivora]
MEQGCLVGIAKETEEYEKKLEERLFPLDEVELNKRIKKNAERQKEPTLSEISELLDIPEEVLARTRASSPGILSTPEYWSEWYRKTLASSGEAKRANRDFRSENERKKEVNSFKEYLLKEVRALYEQETPLIKLKLDERGARCVSCRSLAGAVTQKRVEKHVSFDASSLLAEGLRGSREDQSNGVYQQVYVVTDSIRHRRNPGLVEVPGVFEDSTDSLGIHLEGKRIIGAVGGIEAVSTGFIDCVPVDMRIDSGAVASLVDIRVLKRVGFGGVPLQPYDLNLNGVSGKPLDNRGVIDLPIRLGSQEIILPFAVVKRLHVDGILGTDALKAFKAVIDLETDSVTLKATGEVFPFGSPRVEEMYTARMSSTTRIRPGSQALVVTEVLGEIKGDSTVLVEGWSQFDSTLRVARTLCTVHDHKVIAEVCNASTEDGVIKAGTLVATVTMVPETAFNYETTTASEGDAYQNCTSLVSKGLLSATGDSRTIHSITEFGSIASKAEVRDSMPDLKKVLREDLEVNVSDSKLGDEQKKIFKNVLDSFADLFVETSLKPGRTDLLKFSINTGDHPPIKQRPYRVSQVEGDVMEAEIQQYLGKGFIGPSNSPWASPVLMIRKPDGGVRFRIDYRRLNGVTIKDCYPMPLIDDILDVLGNAKLFSTMDITSGYWNVPMIADSIEKTTFTCIYGLYEWLVILFGLCNAVPAFERLMENVLVDLKWRTCLAYLDNCIVFNKRLPYSLDTLEASTGTVSLRWV